jgi:hypothetical protein
MPGPGTGAGGILGVALETTSGTYQVPTKFVPIEDESLQFQQDTVWRRPIRASADVIGAVMGNAHVEGDITMEALDDILPYFLMASRATFVKTGTTPNFTYVFTPSASAVPLKTMSITVVRAGEVFGYTGCIVGSYTISIDDGMLKFNPTILGQDEATAATPVPVWPTTTPYGAGSYNLQVPTATQIFDADTFEFGVDDSPEAQYRLKSAGRGAAFVAYGERNTTLSMERDFITRAEYDQFKALTAQSLTLQATKGANQSIQIDMPAIIRDTYEVGLGGQGDLIRATVAYQGTADASGKAYQVTIKTQENIT